MVASMTGKASRAGASTPRTGRSHRLLRSDRAPRLVQELLVLGALDACEDDLQRAAAGADPLEGRGVARGEPGREIGIQPQEDSRLAAGVDRGEDLLPDAEVGDVEVRALDGVGHRE